MMEPNPMTNEVTPDETLDIQPISRPQVRIVKRPYRENPLKKGAVFTIHGAGYMVYEVKARGRLLIRYMGKVERADQEEVEVRETEDQDNG